MATKEKVKKEEALTEYIKECTKEWVDEEWSGTATKASDKAVKVGKVLESIKGINAADKKELAKGFGYVLGEDIPWESDDKIELPKMVGLFITGAFDNHGYVLNELVIHTSSGMGIMANGEVGAYLNPPKKFIRPATQAELDAIPAAQLKGIFKETDIIIR
jgi:hypothetical protein